MNIRIGALLGLLTAAALGIGCSGDLPKLNCESCHEVAPEQRCADSNPVDPTCESPAALCPSGTAAKYCCTEEEATALGCDYTPFTACNARLFCCPSPDVGGGG